MYINIRHFSYLSTFNKLFQFPFTQFTLHTSARLAIRSFRTSSKREAVACVAASLAASANTSLTCSCILLKNTDDIVAVHPKHRRSRRISP